MGDHCIFLQAAKRSCIIAASINSELLVLTRDCVEDVVEEFPKILPIFQDVRRNLEQGVVMGAGTTCPICQQAGHDATSCGAVADMRVSRISTDLGRRKSGLFALARASIAEATARATRLTAG